MSVRTLDGPGLDLGALRHAVDESLARFLDSKAGGAGAEVLPDEVLGALREFVLGGGKRLRPLLCLLGWAAAGGGPAPASVVQVAASLEMFHTFALLHDDVMDGSATRRGRPTLHQVFADRHGEGLAPEQARQVGAAAAVLVGDLALSWSDELLHTAGLAPAQLAAVLPVVDVMRTEVMSGQYLDVTGSGRRSADVERALTVVRYKTAKYTVERPLHIGAALAGADEAFRAVLSEFAVPLGEAFQLRDDVLGVFGDPATTGKSALDDLREAKATVLTALAMQRATPGQAEQLAGLLGRSDLTEEQADTARQILTATGARRLVEDMIRERRERAVAALDTAPVAADAREALRHLAEAAVSRSA
ncbi:polyprenyl synthetase family protein [Streptomyces sp. NPDC001591]|uniref:polyprenyl synthetase family protein n=1 Tax=Streptomyces sp. NPDC001591 TaxID=3364589 RepID=UPI0036A29D16